MWVGLLQALTRFVLATGSPDVTVGSEDKLR